MDIILMVKYWIFLDIYPIKHLSLDSAESYSKYFKFRLFELIHLFKELLEGVLIAFCEIERGCYSRELTRA